MSHLLIYKKNAFRMRRQLLCEEAETSFVLQCRCGPTCIQMMDKFYFFFIPVSYVYQFTLPWLLQNNVLQLKPAANFILL